MPKTVYHRHFLEARFGKPHALAQFFKAGIAVSLSYSRTENGGVFAKEHS